jgi:hypothetical protein
MNLLHTSYNNLEFYNITSLLINEDLNIFSNNKIISFIFLYIIFMVVTLFINQYINIISNEEQTAQHENSETDQLKNTEIKNEEEDEEDEEDDEEDEEEDDEEDEEEDEEDDEDDKDDEEDYDEDDEEDEDEEDEDDDDGSSDKNFNFKKIHCNIFEINKNNYPELYNFFEFQLTKKKLLKIVGTKYKNLVKKDLVKLALEKFKSVTINNSLENFKYFSSNFKSYLKSNQKLYKSEVTKLFNVVN